MFNIGLSEFIELTPDLVCIAGKDGFLKKVNGAVIEKLGYTEEELYNKPISSFMHPADRERTMQNRFNLYRGEILHNFSNRYITKKGKVIWLEWTSVYIADKEIVFAIAKDITARKKIEEEVKEQYSKFKGLASHFKNQLEKDRRYFAYELHEQLAQLVSVVNMDLIWLNKHVSNTDKKVVDRTEHAAEVCKLMIKTIQRLAFSVSPLMLDDIGLQESIEWLCNEFSVLNGINCRVKADFDEQHLSTECKIDLFRICQETLSEIIDLSQAGNISVLLRDTGNRIELSILDDGNGFNSDIEKYSDGLVSIRERVSSINASLSLQKNTPGGSGLLITVEKQFFAASV